MQEPTQDEIQAALKRIVPAIEQVVKALQEFATAVAEAWTAWIESLSPETRAYLISLGEAKQERETREARKAKGKAAYLRRYKNGHH